MILYKKNAKSPLIGLKVKYKGGVTALADGFGFEVGKYYEIGFGINKHQDDSSIYDFENLYVMLDGRPYLGWPLNEDNFDVEELISKLEQ